MAPHVRGCVESIKHHIRNTKPCTTIYKSLASSPIANSFGLDDLTLTIPFLRNLLIILYHK